MWGLYDFDLENLTIRIYLFILKIKSLTPGKKLNQEIAWRKVPVEPLLNTVHSDMTVAVAGMERQLCTDLEGIHYLEDAGCLSAFHFPQNYRKTCHRLSRSG